MLKQIEVTVREKLKLIPGIPLVIGVSGGADSLCLGHWLAGHGYTCAWAYFDHQLRDTGEEAAYVQRMAEQSGAGFLRGQGDVQAYALQKGLSIEEAGRELRYQFLFQEAEKRGAQAVAVAHTANDQVETLLMHLLRGSGLDGLKGMLLRSLPNPWSGQVPLVRPLLSTWREEIEAYLAHHQLTAIQDPTNQQTTFYRNRLRHELIPFLENYNPNVRALLWNTADLLGEDQQVLLDAAATAWKACRVISDGKAVALDRQAVLAQPLAIQRRLLRQAINELRPGLRNIDYETIQRGLAFFAQPSESGLFDLAAGLRLMAENDWVWVAPWESELPSLGLPQVDREETLSVPGEVDLGNGWRIRAEWVEAPAGEIFNQTEENRDPYQAWLEAGRLQPPVLVRARQPGERFQPLGMSGHSMKLSDFFINQKTPRRARERWPVVVVGGQIAWIPGYRLGEPFRVSPETTRSAWLQLLPA